MSDSSEITEWLGVAEACEFLSVGKTTLYGYMSAGELPFFYLTDTGNRRTKKSDLLNLLIPGKPHFSSPSTELQKWLKISGAASYIKVTKQTLYNYMSDDRLPYYYLKGTQHRRVKKSDVETLFVPGYRPSVSSEDVAESDEST